MELVRRASESITLSSPMKTNYRLILTTVALSLILVPASGCINLSFGRRAPAPPLPAPPPAVVVATPPLTPADAATIAEIDAAARLDFDASKQQALGQIAQRAALTPG